MSPAARLLPARARSPPGRCGGRTGPASRSGGSPPPPRRPARGAAQRRACSSGWSKSADEPVADQVGRGEEAGEEQQRDGGEQLVLVEEAVVGLADEVGEQVVGRLLAPPGDQVDEVGVELVAGPLDLGQLLRRALEGVGRDEDPHERPEPVPVLLGDPDHLPHHRHRHGEGQFGHHVGLAEVGQPVEPLGDDGRHPGLEGRHGRRDERPLGRAPQPGVLRWVGGEHRRPPPALGQADPLRVDAVAANDELVVLADPGVAEDLAAGIEPGDVPDPVEAAPVDGRRRPEPAVQGVRIGVTLGGGHDPMDQVVGLGRLGPGASVVTTMLGLRSLHSARCVSQDATFH